MSDAKTAKILNKGIRKIEISDLKFVLDILEQYPIEHALKIIREYKADLEEQNGRDQTESQ